MGLTRKTRQILQSETITSIEVLVDTKDKRNWIALLMSAIDKRQKESITHEGIAAAIEEQVVDGTIKPEQQRNERKRVRG